MSRTGAAALQGATALYGVKGKMTRRLLGLVIGTQGLAVFFGALVARGLASANGSPTSGSFLLIGSLAILCLLDAGLLRRPWGITAGWALQVATLACAFIVPAMLLVGLLFAALWLTALVQGGSMDEHTKRVDAQWYGANPTLTAEGASPAVAKPAGAAPEGAATAGVPKETSAPEPAPGTDRIAHCDNTD